MTTHFNLHDTTRIARRHFIGECGVGLGAAALATLLAADRGVGMGSAAPRIVHSDPNTALPPHYVAKAKQVIFLFMAGGPSQLELFDHKPELQKYDGKQVPAEVIKGLDLPFIERDAALMASPVRFSRHGKSGAEISENYYYTVL